MNHGEFQHQCALFEWARLPLMLRKYPELALLSSSQNGAHMDKAEAVRAKRAGLLPGELDVKLPVARGGFIGLALDMKYGDNRPTKEQMQYGMALALEGHLVAFVWTWEAARDLIVKYLEGDLNRAC